MRKLIALAFAAAASLIVAAVAFGAVTTTFEVTATPSKASTKKKVRPITLEINVATTDPAATQPPPLKQVVIRFNKGGSSTASCSRSASFAELQAQGPERLPEGLEGRHRHRDRLGEAGHRSRERQASRSTTASPRAASRRCCSTTCPTSARRSPCRARLRRRARSRARTGQGKCDYLLTFDVPDIPTLPNAPPASVLSVKTKTAERLRQEEEEGQGQGDGQDPVHRRAQEVHGQLGGRRQRHVPRTVRRRPPKTSLPCKK